MSDKLTLDRETFKVLAADTRVDILKKLEVHKLTLTDMAGQMNMSPSTIKEHLNRLVEVGLIEQDDRGMKWKYYRLTAKGRNIVSPQETTVWILLGTSLLALAGASLSLYGKLGQQTLAFASKAAEPAPQLMASRGELQSAEDMVAGAVNESVKTLAAGPPSTVIERALQHIPEPTRMPLPWLELAVIALCLIVFGYCMGNIMKKKIRLE